MKRFFLLLIGAVLYANVLQDVIDKAAAGSKIELPKGVFKGAIVIDKPLMIVGEGNSTIIDGEGKGTVVKIRSSNVTLKNVAIVNSGSEHEKVDAGISVKDSNFVTIEHCTIKNSLFGIDLQNVRNSKIVQNYIQSKPFSLGLR